MFHHLRRPVPSKAALKLLYQLAYISSGTAVGVATLCTEERRRRAKIMQNIADNAKRIRQSPRYVHNAAARREEGERESVRYEPEQQEEEDWRRRAVRDSDLPSKVERGYEQVVARDHKRTRRRRRNDFHTDEESGKEKSKPSLRGPKSTREAPLVRQVVDGGTSLFRVYEKQQGRKVLSFRGNVEEYASTHVPLDLRHLLKEAKDLTVFTPDETSTCTPQSVSRDISIFFQAQPWSKSGITEKEIVRKLFSNALECGTFLEMRSLYQWLLARNALEPSHIAALCDACYDLAERMDHQELFDLYKALFTAEEFQRLSASTQIHHCLGVAEASEHWRLEGITSTRARRTLCKKVLKTKTLDQTIIVLDEYLNELLPTNNHARAHRLVKIAGFGWRHAWQRKFESSAGWLHLQVRLLRSALDHGQLRLAWPLLRHEMRNRAEGVVPYLERVSMVCTQQGSYKYLSLMLDDPRVRLKIEELAPQLSNYAKAAIAKACILENGHEAYEELFNRLDSTLPENLRIPIMEARNTKLLLEKWRTTRYFASTWNQYLSAREFARNSGNLELQNATDMTMIDICNAANRPDRALELLADFNRREPHSSRSLSSAAVSLAKKNMWARMRQLLKLLEDSGSFVQDGATSKCFNDIIYLFAHRHTSAETWNFVTGLMQNLGFIPTYSTTGLVLQAFVRNKHLSFVSHWARYLRTIGHRFKMDAKMAAGLMNEYYLDQRPPHVLIMWFCREIAKLSPSLDTTEFERVITEAIGFDLRTGKRDVREKAEHNLSIFHSSKWIIPKPVNSLRESFREVDGTRLQSPTNVSSPGSMGMDVVAFRQVSPETIVQVEDDKVGKEEDVLDREHDTAADGQEPSAEDQPSNPRHKESPSDEQYFNMVRDFNTEENDSASGGASTPVVSSQPEQVESADFLGFGLDHTTGEIAQPDDGIPEDLADAEADVEPEVAPYNTRRRVEGQMVLALSLKQYDKVLELYYSSLSREGLPISPRALEMTVEASFRLHKGSRDEVDGILAGARNAGMNVSCALGPILIHHTRHLDPNDKRDANKLRLIAMEYYRSNEENGWPVSNHLVVQAAKTLIQNHRAEYGINLLSDINQSKWAQEHPLDIVAMTVFLQGYTALGSAKGIQWTIQTVLRKKMRMDKRFVEAVKMCHTVNATKKPNARTASMRTRLRAWHRLCSRIRLQQRHETKVFGRNLVKFIVKLSNQPQKPTIESDLRRQVESQLFGASPLSDVAEGSLPPKERAALRRARGRIAHAIGWDRGLRPEGRRTAELTRNHDWLRQYRAFLRRDIVMPDGKLASFRYRMANVPRWKARGARRRSAVLQGPQDDGMPSDDDIEDGDHPELSVGEDYVKQPETTESSEPDTRFDDAKGGHREKYSPFQAA